MVYAGYINKNIVAMLQANSCNAIGLCGADGDSVLAHKRQHPVMDYGFVGDVDLVNTNLISNFIEHHICPVFAPITHDQQGQLLNTNADTIAQEIAVGMSGQYEVTLMYLFEKSGVLMDSEDEGTVIPKLDRNLFKQLKSKEKIFAGMLPKLENAFTALNKGLNQVIVGKADDILEIMKGKTGTVITNA